MLNALKAVQKVLEEAGLMIEHGLTLDAQGEAVLAEDAYAPPGENGAHA